MNRIRLSLITLGLIGSSLSAAWIINGVETNIEHPLQLSERSVENGGNLSAIDAYEDGVGVFMTDSPAVDSTKIDNSAFNELVYKYGEVAKLAGISISDQVLSGVNNPEPTVEDIRLANIIKGNTVNSEFFSDGIACDDLNADTTDDVYTDGLCLGTYVDGTSCDDGNSNTINDIYTSGFCSGICDDGNIDTIDTLQNDGTCLYQFIDGVACDDNNSATYGDKYLNNICSGEVVRSCKEILDIGASTGDGYYNINPTKDNSFQVYCDMTTDDGGWTLISEEFDSFSGWNDNTNSYQNDLKTHGTFGYETPFVYKIFYTEIPHTEVKLNMNFLSLDSWDGDEEGYIKINDNKIWSKIRTGGARSCDGWDNFNDGQGDDPWDGQGNERCIVPLNLINLSSDTDIKITIGSTIDQTRTDEAWGFSRFGILIR